MLAHAVCVVGQTMGPVHCPFVQVWPGAQHCTALPSCTPGQHAWPGGQHCWPEPSVLEQAVVPCATQLPRQQPWPALQHVELD